MRTVTRAEHGMRDDGGKRNAEMTAENAERGMTAENEDESWGSGVIDWRSGAMTGDLGRLR